MADTSNLSKFLSDVADAIRTKKDVIDPIPAANFDTEILSIDVGTDTSDADAAEENIEKGKTAYVNGEKITGTLEDAGSSADVMVAPTNIKIGNERGWDCVSTTYTNTNKKIHRDGWYVDQHIKFEDLAPKLGVTPEIIVSGNTILGVEGSYEGGGSGEGTEDATATADDVLSPKTFYADGRKQTGAIQTTYQTITGGMNSELDETARSYWIADICDKYGIAVVYTYNSGNWYLYKWDGIKLGSVLLSLTSGTYPSGSLMKSVGIAKDINNQGYLNVWCHAVNSAAWSDDMQGYLGVFQYDVSSNTIVKKVTIQTSKPGGYTRDWNEDGNMAVCPTDPNKCFVAYHNKDRIYMQLLVYNNISNSISRSNNEITGTSTPCFSSEWNDDGTYVLVSRGAKSHPEQYFVIQINANNTISRKYYASNTKPNSIYKHYIILGNKIYDFSSGSLVLMNTWSYITDYTQGGGITWTYGDYLFTSNYATATLYCFKINDDLTLTPLFSRKAGTYVGSSYSQYMGTTVMPASNSFLYFSPTLTMMYKFSETNTTNKVASMIVQGETFGNTNIVTATKDDVLLGKIFLDKDGENTGTMANNGYLDFTPSMTAQNIPKGYASGGIVRPINADVDNNIIPENIRNGVTILGVEGEFEGFTGGDATSDANIQEKYLLEGYSAVSDGKWVEGTMVNHGTVDMAWSSEVQEIPTGYYDELYIPRAVASNLDGYDECSDALSVVMYGQNWKYTELNYIESTGNQFIDINYIPKTLHTKYEVGFMRLSVNSYWNPIINNEEDVRFGIMCTKDTNDGNDINNGQFHIGASDNMQAVTFPVENNVKYDITADKTGISLNGTKYEIEGEVADATGTWSACINHRYISATEFSPEHSIGRWYYLRVYEDEVLVKNLVPAIETATNKVCMYDTIGRVFYHNIGEGNFISGGVKE